MEKGTGAELPHVIEQAKNRSQSPAVNQLQERVMGLEPTTITLAT